MNKLTSDKILLTDVIRQLLEPPAEGKRMDLIYLKVNHHWQIRQKNDLQRFIASYPEMFHVADNQKVFPMTRLTVCPMHSHSSGSCQELSCRGLHFCVFYLLSGQCHHGHNCLFGHSLQTPHNARLLQDHRVSGLDTTDLRTLLCLPWVRRGVTIPKVCKYYNVHAGCTRRDLCSALHLCRPYVQGHCKFGPGCKRNHNVNSEQVTKILQKYGVQVKGRRLTAILAEVRKFLDIEDDSSVEGGHSASRKGYETKGTIHLDLASITNDLCPVSYQKNAAAQAHAILPMESARYSSNNNFLYSSDRNFTGNHKVPERRFEVTQQPLTNANISQQNLAARHSDSEQMEVQQNPQFHRYQDDDEHRVNATVRSRSTPCNGLSALQTNFSWTNEPSNASAGRKNDKTIPSNFLFSHEAMDILNRFKFSNMTEHNHSCWNLPETPLNSGTDLKRPALATCPSREGVEHDMTSGTSASALRLEDVLSRYRQEPMTTLDRARSFLKSSPSLQPDSMISEFADYYLRENPHSYTDLEARKRAPSVTRESRHVLAPRECSSRRERPMHRSHLELIHPKMEGFRPMDLLTKEQEQNQMLAAPQLSISNPSVESQAIISPAYQQSLNHVAREETLTCLKEDAVLQREPRRHSSAYDIYKALCARN